MKMDENNAHEDAFVSDVWKDVSTRQGNLSTLIPCNLGNIQMRTLQCS